MVNFEQWTFLKSIVSDRDWNINDKEQKPSTKKIFRKKDVGEDKEKKHNTIKNFAGGMILKRAIYRNQQKVFEKRSFVSQLCFWQILTAAKRPYL